MIRADATRALDFWFGYVTDRMYGNTSSGSAPAIATGLGKAANRAGVTWFTRSSVHWADSTTATSSSNGFT
jgi:hypothetical protein